MALQMRARYKPDMYRSSLEAQVGGESGDGSAGTVYLAVEIIQWDDADIPAINSVVFGDPDVEKFITVVLPGVVQLDIPSLDGMTNANRLTQLQNALDSWATANKGLAIAVARIVRVARKMNARAIS